MLRNMKVGTKLIAVLIAPLVVLAVLAAIGINQRRSDASDAKQVEELTQLSAFNAAAIHQLELEMNKAAADLGSEGARIDDYTAQVAKTDEQLAKLQETLQDVDTGGNEEFQAAVDSAETRLEDLGTVRTGVEGEQFKTAVAIDQYLETIDALLDVNFQASLAAKTPSLADALENLVLFSQGKREVAEEVSVLSGVVEGPDPQRFTDSEGVACEETSSESCSSWQDFLSSQAEADDIFLAWQDKARPEEKSLYRNATSGPEVRAADDMIDKAFTAGNENQAMEIDRNAWLPSSIAKLDALYQVEAGDETDSLVVGVLNEAQDQRSQADREVQVFILITILAIAVSLGLALLVARAVARPLQQLTEAANTLSTERLPSLVEQLRNPEAQGIGGFAEELTPIDINSKDEIGQLADAFNSIQQVTVEVAEEQAQLLRKGIGDIFINLARRNQTLLDRQIEFIDQLEANEEDPDQLDNLFKLDHLATRMRRNAESLLVLAGAEPPRRRGKPVALADVVRVAIGEVEDFARISLLALDDALVGGNVAVDLAHLLSELMENATHFSPPDTHVEVVGHITPDGGYTISVSDQGIGMSSEQLNEANHLLSNPPLVGLALSRSLGFIVIGRLAGRFEVDVELTASPSGGVTALVKLPRDLVTDDEGQPLPVDAETAAALAAVAELDAPPDFGSDELDVVEVAEVDELEAAEDGGPVVVDDYLGVEADDEIVVEELVEEAVVVDELGEDEEYEEYEEEIEEYEEDLEEPTSFEEAVPEGEAFERGLESLISGETPPGPIESDEPGMAPSEPEPEPEPEAEPEPEPEPELETEPEPVGATAMTDAADAFVDTRPPPTAPPVDSDMTAAGLVKRTPKKQKAEAVGTGPLRTAATTQRPTSTTKRSPEEVRQMLSRYRGGLKKGRDGSDEEGS
jgi:signal transduction histidine kinase